MLHVGGWPRIVQLNHATLHVSSSRGSVKPAHAPADRPCVLLDGKKGMQTHPRHEF
jgi:hypothetical protein